MRYYIGCTIGRDSARFCDRGPCTIVVDFRNDRSDRGAEAVELCPDQSAYTSLAGPDGRMLTTHNDLYWLAGIPEQFVSLLLS